MNCQHRPMHKGLHRHLWAGLAVIVIALSSPTRTPAELLFFDGFEYDVGRDDTNAVKTFQEQGWAWAKIEQEGRGGGYIFTASQIPGYTGAFPGKASQRALVIEAKPGTFRRQTDFYLQYGGPEAPIGHIPPNHWFQFWVYVNDYGEQRSLISTSKFIYPNRATYYPATIDNGGYIYLMPLLKGSHVPLSVDPYPGSVGGPGGFICTVWNNAHGRVDNHIEYNNWKFGANLSKEIHSPSNQWTLVKIHVDLSGTDPRAAPGQSVYEQWIRRLGSDSWTKTTEYIGGVTEVNGLPINFTPVYRDGFRMFRMPTTVGATTDAKGDWFDYWLYMDDFALATSEADLPTYGALPEPSPTTGPARPGIGRPPPGGAGRRESR